MTERLLLWGVVVHLVADWLLQNHWMATYKTSLKHPAAWVHSAIHFAGALLVFHPLAALFIFVTHILIDTRIPLRWWRGFYQQTGGEVTRTSDDGSRWVEVVGGVENRAGLHVAMWGDQVAHIAVIAIAALAQSYLL